MFGVLVIGGLGICAVCFFGLSVERAWFSLGFADFDIVCMGA